MKKYFLLMFSLLCLLFPQAKAQTYCTPTVTNIAGYGIGMTNFTMGTINNTTTTPSAPPIYFDFTNLSTSGLAGATINFSVTLGPGNSTKTAIFIDWNKDGTFATSGSEFIWTNTTTTAGTTQSGSFVVPSVSAGVYRMRVSSDFGFNTPSPCNNGYGDFEDYLFVVNSSSGVDAMAYTVSSPSSYVVGNNTIGLRWFNLGGDSIKTANIGYSINGGGAVTQTITDTVLGGRGRSNNFTTQANLAVGNYTMKVWVRNPNSTYPDLNVNNDTINTTFKVCASRSGTYTINSALPTSGTNYASFTEAVNDIVCGGITGPVVFNVAAGTYNEQISIPPVPGASATNTITFTGGAGNAATRVLQYGFSSLSNYAVVDLNGADYVTFKHLTIKSTSASYGWGFNLRAQANYNNIDSCIIDMSACSNGTGPNVIGINASNSPTSAFSNGNNANYCNIRNNQILGSATGGVYYGINIYGSTTSSTENNKILIANNTIQDFYYSGIYVYYYADSMIIRGNDIARPNRNSSTTLYGIYNYFYSQNRLIENNRIHNLNGGQSGNGNTVYCLSDWYCFNLGNNIIRNNLIYDIGGNGPTYGLYSYYSYANKYYHNTISLDGTAASSSNLFGISYYAGTSSNFGQEFRNNIVSVTRPGTSAASQRYGFHLQDNAAFVCDNNVYFVNAASASNFYGYYLPTNIFYNTFADWQGRVSTMEQNSVAANPQFTNLTSNLIPQNCGVNNVGFALTAVPTDVAGLSRSSSTPDPGAHEFTAGGSIDAGISAVSSSAFSGLTCSGTAAFTANLRNLGSSSLTSVTVNWSVNGVGQTPISWTGTLASGASAVVNLGNVTLTTGANYIVRAFTSSPNSSTDACGANDTATFIKGTGMSGVYTINPAGSGNSNYVSFSDAVSALTQRGLCGPVTFNVASGTYTEQFSMAQINGASATNTVTFKSASNNAADVILQFNSVSNNYIVDMNGVDFVNFRNMTLTALNNNNGIIFNFRNTATYDSISNCVLNGVFTTSTSTALSLIYSSNTADSANVITNNTLNNGTYGVYWNAPSSPRLRNEILNNGFNNQYIYGIFMNYPDRSRIRNNVITTSTAYTAATAGIYIQNAYNNLLVDRNSISCNLSGTGGTYYGIYNSSINGTVADSALFANNEIMITSASAVVYGIFVSGANYSRYYNNSVLINAVGTTTSYAAYFGSATNSRILNNLLVNRRTGASAWALYKNIDATTPSNFNILFSAGTNLSSNGTNYTTLASWQASTNTPDLNSINRLPSFANSNSLLMNQACVDNLGTSATLAAVATDKNGATRPSTPDIGAYEFSTPAFDLQSTAIVSPVSYSASAQTVTLRVRNNGSTAITSFDAGYNVNNGSNTAQTFTISTLNACDSTTVSFTTQVTLPSTGLSLIKSYISGNLNGSNADLVKPNDTAYSNLFCNGGLSGTYSINTALPNSFNNFNSFSAAATVLNSCGVSGPVVFNVAAGTYIERFTLNVITGASATNTITFDGGTGNAATRVIQFNFPGSVSNYSVIELNGTDYCRFRNLTIKPTNPSYGYGFVLRGLADYNIIDSCIIDMSAITSTTSTLSAGIALSASVTTSQSTGNHANNCVFSNNRILGSVSSGAYRGISIYASTSGITNSNIIIEKNIIQDFYESGIYTYYRVGSLIIRGNDISRPNRSASTTLFGIREEWYYTGRIVENNRIHALNANQLNNFNTVYGIYDYYPSDPGTNYVRNNLVYDLGGQGSIYGIYTFVNYYTKYFNNTISLDHSTTNNSTLYGVYYYINTGTNQYGQEFKNNIVTVNRPGAGGGARYTMFMPDNSIGVFDNNVYTAASTGVTGNFMGSWNGTNYNTFNDWKNRTNNNELNSIAAEPQFVNITNNLTPQNCAIDNSGVASSFVTTDANGNARGTTPDVGALEFTATGANDASIVDMIAPVSPACVGSQTITVTLKNKGTATLTSANIDWSVNSVAQTPMSWTGSLAPGASVNVNLGTLSFASNTTYNMVVKSSQPNNASDVCMANDSIVVVKRTGLSGTYTIDAAGSGATNFTSFTAAAAALTTGGICGPVVFNVAAGTYAGQVILPTIAGSSSVNTVTFNGGAGNAATRIVQYSATGSNYAGIYLDGTDYVTFKNLTVKSTTSGNNSGIQFANAADNNVVDSCIIDLSSVSFGNTSAGINFATGYTAFSSSTNHGNNNLIRGCTITGSATGGPYYGINLYQGSNFGNSDNRFIGNTITDFYYAGFYISNYVTNTTITDNMISRPNMTGSSSTIYGIWYYYSGGGDIARNKIFNPFGGMSATTNTFYGIYTAYNFQTPYSPNTIANNQIYNINGNGPVHAIYAFYDYYLRVVYNTIVLDNTAATSAAAVVTRAISTGSLYNSGTPAAMIQNNIVILSRGGGSTTNNHALYFLDGAYSNLPVINRNVYSISGATNSMAYRNGTTFAALSNWQSGSGLGHDANSNASAPNFVNPSLGNFKPSNTAVNDIGAVITAVTSNDVNQMPRSTVATDPGSIEWGPLCTGAPTVSGVTIVSGAPICNSSVTLRVNYEVRDSLGFQWQESPNGTNWSNVSGGNGANSFQFTSLPITTTMYYRCVVTCLNSAQSTNSASVMLMPGLAGTYTINASGSGSSNFTSFSAAASALTNFGLCGPVVFNVAPGVYNEQMGLGIVAGSSTMNTITFDGMDSSSAVLTFNFPVTPTNYAIIDLNGTDNIRFKNLVVKTGSNTYGYGFLLRNKADNVVIEKCLLDMSSITSTGTNNSAGITLTGSTNSNSFTGNHANNLTIQNNRIKGSSNGGAYRGINIYANTANFIDNSNIIIRNNVIEDFFESGIYVFYFTPNDLISGNTISMPNRNSTTTVYGIYSYYPYKRSIEKNNIYNLSSSSACYGISDQWGQTYPGNTINNNYIGNFRGTGTRYGIYNYYTYNGSIAHNTVNFNSGTSFTGTMYGFMSYGSTSASYTLEFKNNILNMTNPGGVRYGVYLAGNPYYCNSNNNVLNINGAGSTNYLGYRNANYTTLASWQAIGYDLLSLAVDPLLGADMIPTNTAVNNTGTNNLLVAVPTDFYGKNRNSTKPDAGCIEWIPICINAGVAMGTPYQGIFRSGTELEFDHLKAQDTVTYKIDPPAGTQNSDFGTLWTITNFSVKTKNGSNVIPADTFTVMPSASGAGYVRFVPSQSFTDSTVIVSFNIVSLTANECLTPVKRYVYVAPVPVADFDSVGVCFGNAMNFDNNSTLLKGVMSYYWDFGDTPTDDNSPSDAPSYTFTAPGTYNVTLIVTSDLGYKDTVVKVVNIGYLPKAKYNFNAACDGQAINFVNQTTIDGPAQTFTYKWDLADGGPINTSTNPSKTYASYGSYQVKLTATSAAGCENSVTHNVTVFPKPTANFSTSNSCLGDNTSFTNSSSVAYGNLGYNWNFGDGTLSNLPSPSKTYTTASTFTVKLKVYTAYGCLDSMSKQVTVNVKPTAGFTSPSNCMYDSVSFANTTNTNGGPVPSYTWTFGDGGTSSSSAATVKHKYLAPGGYNVTLLAANGNCSDSKSMLITVDEAPDAAFTTDGNKCLGKESEFTNLSSIGTGTISYSWNFGGQGTSSLEDPDFTFTTAANHDIWLKVTSDKGCVDSVKQTVTIYGLPDTSFTMTNTSLVNQRQVKFTPVVKTYYGYDWDFGDGNSNQQIEPVHSYLENGPFLVTLKVTDVNNCELKSSARAIGFNVSSGRVNAEFFSFDMYPNPFNNQATVSYQLDRSGKVDIRIFDMTGKELFTLVSEEQAKGKYELNLTEAQLETMAAGTYFVRFNVSGNVQSKQLIRVK